MSEKRAKELLAKFSIDEDLLDEVQEEIEKLTGVWHSLFGECAAAHVTEGDQQVFNDLITRLGTTYCEEVLRLIPSFII